MNQASVPQCVIPMFVLMLFSTFGLQYVVDAQEKSDKQSNSNTNVPQAEKGLVAQTTATPDTQSAELAEANKLLADFTSNFNFSLLSNEMTCSPNALLDLFAAHPQNTSQLAHTKLIEPKAVEPKVQISLSSKDVAIRPHEQKLNNVSFTEPETDSKQAPKTFHASAYAFQGRTRSGVQTQAGTIAADPRVLPLGTVVQVNAGKYSGVYTVHDTGGSIKGNRVDVWLPTNKEARRFGRRQVKLVVLRYPGKNRPSAQPSKGN